MDSPGVLETGEIYSQEHEVFSGVTVREAVVTRDIPGATGFHGDNPALSLALEEQIQGVTRRHDVAEVVQADCSKPSPVSWRGIASTPASFGRTSIVSNSG